jgi:hypothetical protein
MRQSILLLAVVCGFHLSVLAAPSGLKRATVEEISGEVVIKREADATGQKAALKDSVTGKDIIRTGKKSRAELEFEDRSICRLGSNTVFSFDPQSRDMAFARGVALVHVPPGQGGARIATPAATAAIQGDTIVIRATVMPDGTSATQFTALSPRGGPTDGNIIVTLNNNPNASFRLEGGQIAIVPANATSLSQVPRAEVDIGTFSRNSPMLQNLPDTAKQEVSMVSVSQNLAFDSGAAQRTEYAIVGDQVVKADANGNFTAPPPPAPVPTTTATTTPIGGTVMADGTVVMPDGTTVSPDGTITKTDGTTLTSTTLADGTQVMPDGTTVSPDGTITKTDGTTFTGTTEGTTSPSGTTTAISPSGTYTAPDGTTFTSGGGTYSTATTTFFSPDASFNTLTSFQATLAQVTGGTTTTAPHPPFLVSYGGNVQVTLNGASLGVYDRFLFNTDTGSISYFDTSSANPTISAFTLGTDYNFGRDDVLGISQFAFDRLTITAAPIKVEGSYELRLHTVNNSAAAAPLQIGTGNSTVTFASGTPNRVNMVTDYSGNITQAGGGTLTVSGGVEIGSPSGSVTLAGTVDTSGSAPGNPRAITVNAANNISVNTLTASGTGVADGGLIDVRAPNGTVTLNGALTSNGGATSADGGTINVKGNTVAFAGTASDIIANGVGGGDGGKVSVDSASSLATVAGAIITADGASGGAGGTIDLKGASIAIPAGSQISATGSDVAITGGKGGTVNLTATTSSISLTTSGSSIIQVGGGNGTTGVGGQGGTVNLTGTAITTTSGVGTTAGIISAAGGTATTGTGGLGGTINIDASSGNISLSSTATGSNIPILNVVGGVSSSGTGGKGGTIDLATAVGNISAATSTDATILNAAGATGSTGGQGGALLFSAPTSIIITDTAATAGSFDTISAAAGSGGSPTAGTITVQGITQTSASHLNIDASGSTSASAPGTTPGTDGVYTQTP